MRVLLVHNRYQITGGEEVVFEQERQLLKRAGHEVLTYTRTNFEAETYTGLKQIALVKNVAWSQETRSQLAAVIGEFSPDIVHVHNTFMMMSSSVFATCREMDVPVVQTLHNYRMFCPAGNFVHRDGYVCEECTQHGLKRGVRYGCYRESRLATATVALSVLVQRKRHAFADSYIALTEFARQKFVWGGLAAEMVCVKPNFVHPDPGPRSGMGDRAVYVGRLAQEKGLLTLLKAWKELKVPVPLSIVGDGPMISILRKMADELKPAPITFHGRLPREDTLELLKSARFMVAPSECYENFPMSIAEAFACGVPVICSRLGAMQEIVENKRTGLHFIPGNAADLAANVLWSWSHPHEMMEMGQEARRVYEAKYTGEKNYPMLMEIYERVVARAAATNIAPAAVRLSLSRG
ncbi:MAG: glycosyltransferase family 4 protein [Acidobacteriales bacterium]|nr:glycosyltransferase family 4 protein [Terriglobales bacterium]